MIIVTSSDWHADRDTLGASRTAEVSAAVRASVDRAIDERADAYFFLGDVADPETGGSTYHAIDILISAALMCIEHGIPFIAVAGNHDVYEDGSGATTLTPLRSVADRVKGAGGARIWVAERPMFVKLSPDYDVLCLPFAPVSHAYDPAEVAATHFEMSKTPTIVLGHLCIPGAVQGEETTDMPRGREVVFPVAETEHAFLRMNGHYHHRQMTREGIVIPGSLARFTFSDERAEPCFLVTRLPEGKNEQAAREAREYRQRTRGLALVP